MGLVKKRRAGAQAPYNKLTDEEARAAKTDPVARAHVLKRLTPLVKSIVNRMNARHEAEAADMMQEGFIGLIRAVDTYQPTGREGVHFGGWARYWVFAFVQRARYGTSAKRFKPLDIALSLDAELGDFSSDGDPVTLLDVLEDEEAVPGDKAVQSSEDKELLKEVVAMLSPERQRIWNMRFTEEKTLEEIGAVFDCTRERIRQILYAPRTGLVDKVTAVIKGRRDGALDAQTVRALRKVSRRRGVRRVGQTPRKALPRKSLHAGAQAETNSSEGARRGLAGPVGANPKRAEVARRPALFITRRHVDCDCSACAQ